MGIPPQKIPSPDSEIAQDALEQTEMIFQDVRRNAMQASIKYKAYYDKKSQCLKTYTIPLCSHSTAESRPPGK